MFNQSNSNQQQSSSQKKLSNSKKTKSKVMNKARMAEKKQRNEMNKVVAKYMTKIKNNLPFDFEEFSRACQVNNKSYFSPEPEEKK